jgi:pimeloyl-ACP methyl ester carboxylesterase
MKFEESPNTFKPRFIRKVKSGQDNFVMLLRQRLHYIEAGQGDPIIMIPGSYVTYRIWNRLLPLLAAEYRVLAPEYPGGLPGKAVDLSLFEQTDLILQFTRQLNLGKVVLMGGLKGGGVIFHLAAAYPDLVRAIVGVEGGLIQPDGAHNGPKNALLKQWDRLKSVRKAKLDLEGEARAIKCPLMYLYGTGSDYKTIQLERNIAYLKENLPQAWIVALEGTMQGLARNSPEEIANLVLEFLNTALKQSPQVPPELKQPAPGAT